ncbi:Caffeine induced death protein Cid2 [Schizosaccharomyces pombe]
MSEEKRGLCMNIRYLKNVLRKARKIDDTIQLSLNSAKWEYPEGKVHETQEERCQNVKKKLFEGWLSRDQFLKECQTIVRSQLDQDRNTSKSPLKSQQQLPSSSTTQVSERLDPYAKEVQVQLSPPEEVQIVLQSELSVEQIIRDQTWEVLTNACPGMFKDWRDTYKD